MQNREATSNMTASLTGTTTVTDAAAHQASQHWLLFTDGAQLFALPSAQILEILCPHPVTPLPFVTPAIDGLINVDGRIAVQLNLGTLTGTPSNSPRTELLLIDTGRALCALKVESVLARVALPDSDINNTLPDELPQDIQPLVSGSTRWMGNTVAILDPVALSRLIRPEGLSEEGTGILGRVTQTEQHTEESTHCLVVRAAGERYAFPLAHVMEIVAGGTCTPVPGAPPYVNGLFLLREAVLLVIDLAKRLASTHQQTTAANWFVILDHEQGRCSFAFDEIIAIEHFPKREFQASMEQEQLVQGIFVSEHHNTLLLNTSALINDEIRTVLTVHNHDTSSRQQQFTESDIRFLQVNIGGTPYVIPLDMVKRVTPFFAMEATQDANQRIRGAIDLDGEIIPVLALEYGLTLPHAVIENQYVVIDDKHQQWALSVDAADRIVSVPKSLVNHLTQSDARYVGGVVQLDERLLSLLDFSVLSDHSGEPA
jgi:purine-binding chemotaxis protein CheW